MILFEIHQRFKGFLNKLRVSFKIVYYKYVINKKGIIKIQTPRKLTSKHK